MFALEQQLEEAEDSIELLLEAGGITAQRNRAEQFQRFFIFSDKGVTCFEPIVPMLLQDGLFTN